MKREIIGLFSKSKITIEAVTESVWRYRRTVGLLLLLTFTTIQCEKKIDNIKDDIIETPDKPLNPDSSNQIILKPSVDLYGVISDENDNPIPNVVVSDGYSNVITDEKGVYQMRKNTNATFVYYSTPSEYTVQTVSSNNMMANFYQSINPTIKRYDFKLKSLPAVENEFVVLAVGDPQIRTDYELARFKNETIADIRSLVSSFTIPVYSFALGDIMFDKKEFALPIKNQLGAANTPMFVTLGNHDKFTTPQNPIKNESYFSEMFGPTNYSFNRGDVHFISMDNVIFSSNGSYTAGFSDEQLEWLKQDLKYVPKDKMIIMYYHIPLRNNANYKNRHEVLLLLDDFAEVHLMAGHTHYHENVQVTRSISAYEHVHAGACGAWWESTISGDGTPNGYGVFHISGNTMKDWFFKATNYDRSHQLRIHRGSEYFRGEQGEYIGEYSFGLPDDYIIANIWNADSNWTISVYENNIKTGEMTLSFIKQCYWSQAYHIGVLGKNIAGKASHIYQYKLQDPNAEIKVVATDRFGNEYTETEFTSSLTTAGTY